MFNIGPMELLVLAVVGLLVIGPDKLPNMARDAARMLRTLREMATGAQQQLRDELGPEFADVDLRSLNPRTALQRAILGDEEDWRAADPRKTVRSFWEDDDDAPAGEVSLTKDPVTPAPPVQEQPLGRGEQAPFDPDAT